MREKILNLLFVLIVFVLGAGAMYVLQDYVLDSETTTTTTENRNVTITDDGIAEAVDKVYDAVVMIKNYQKGTYTSSGSGFVYKTDDEYGYLLTNYHVVEDADSLYVLYSDETEAEATYLGGDEYLDVAVIRVDKDSVLSVAELGSSEDLKLGDTIFAVGSPVGEEYYNTVTRGVVSGLNRKITVSINSTSDWVMEAIQVDAAINPGNSGGPLVNSNGEVVGINSMKLVDSSVENMGFAIKIEDATDYLDIFENGEDIERPLLGISLINASETEALRRYGINIDSSIEEGVVVVSIVEDSGAAKSDLQEGDVITKIDDKEITNQAYLKYVLYSYNVGDTIEVTYIRGTKEYTTQVTLTKNDE